MTNVTQWDVEDSAFWDSTGKRIANRNLWISVPSLLCGFAVWLYWGIITVQMLNLGFPFSKPELFTLAAIAGFTGATLRIPSTFFIRIAGGRNTIFFTTALLMIPAIGAGFALSDQNTPLWVFQILALLSGFGGGNFASSMSNISFFFPKRMQGLSLGLNAGLGNAGVSVMQFLLPWVITFGAFGAVGGEPHVGAGGEPVWVQNAALVWIPILAAFAVMAYFFMNNLPQHDCGPFPVAIGKCLWLTFLGFLGVTVGVGMLIVPWGGFPVLLKTFLVLLVTVVVTLVLMRFMTPKATKENLKGQFAIFSNKHNWVMTWLYTMTFGSFIGYANAFPKLIDDVFGVVRVGADGSPLAEAISNPGAPISAKYIWIGAGVGALIRPLGGWLSDKLGGARVTQWDTVLMIASTIGAGYCVSLASQSSTPEQYFMPFLLLFIVLFATTGIGNGSTFRMIPIIFSKEQAGPVLGWTSAIAAYGAYLIPKIFATQIKAGTPEYALYGFALYYASCLLVNWWFYARKGAEVPC